MLPLLLQLLLSVAAAGYCYWWLEQGRNPADYSGAAQLMRSLAGGMNHPGRPHARATARPVRLAHSHRSSHAAPLSSPLDPDRRLPGSPGHYFK